MDNYMVDKPLIDVRTFSNYTITESDSNGKFIVKGVVQRAEAKNNNGRVYSKSILEREVDSYNENFVKVGNAFGELDHPESAIVSLKNASHVVKELWWEGNDLKAKIEILNTPSGNIVKEILRAGHAVGISSRGTGTVSQTNENTLEVQDDYELVCWDFVSNPSTYGAFMSPSSNLNENSGYKSSDDKYEKLNSIIREIICSTTNVCEFKCK